MPQTSDRPFESIEEAQQFVHLLAEVIEEAHGAIRDDLALAEQTAGAARRLEALRVVDYKLTLLRGNMATTGRLLNDLRTLRRLLLGERHETE